MQSKALPETSTSKVSHKPRHQTWQVRFSELLSPPKTVRHLTDAHARERVRGWAVRVELPAEEVMALEDHVREHAVDLDVEQLASGQSIALLRASTLWGEVRFGVPLWQSEAQDWLFDVMDHARLLLLLDTTDGLRVSAVSASVELKVDQLSAVAAATLAPDLDDEESRREVLAAARRLLEGHVHRSQQCESEPLPLILSLTCRADDALAAMSCLIEARSQVSFT